MRQMFPQHSERIVNDPQNRTIFDVLKKAHMDGYAGVRIVGGGDRVAEFENCPVIIMENFINLITWKSFLRVIGILMVMTFLACLHPNREKQQQKGTHNFP